MGYELTEAVPVTSSGDVGLETILDIDATVEWDSADAGLSVTIGQGYMKEVA